MVVHCFSFSNLWRFFSMQNQKGSSELLVLNTIRVIHRPYLWAWLSLFKTSFVWDVARKAWFFISFQCKCWSTTTHLFHVHQFFFVFVKIRLTKQNWRTFFNCVHLFLLRIVLSQSAKIKILTNSINFIYI